ncbi:CvpA family protein [Candidatus Omnitrophota bacterium]
MPHIKFNWVDILFVTLLVRICYISFKNGFFPELFRFLGLLSAFIFSFNSYASMSRFISAHARWSSAKLEIISFLFIFLVILFIFKIFALIANLFSNSEDISKINRLAGFLLGIGRALLSISLICILFVNSPFEYLSRNTKEKSFSSQYLLGVAPLVYRNAMGFYPFKKAETPLVKLLER